MNNEDSLRITLLGKININLGDHPLTHLRHRKSLALLAYLVTTGKRHSREGLAGLFWGYTSDANALGGLRKVLAELRSLVGPYLLEQDRQVAFNASLPYQADVLEFEKGLQNIHTQKAESLEPSTINLLQETLDLYQGDFLTGFYVQHAPAFEEWVNLTRERLRLAALDGLFLVSKAAYRQSDYPTSIRYTRRLLELEPANEEAHRLLMSLLALSGQREAALQQYELCPKYSGPDLPPQPGSRDKRPFPTHPRGAHPTRSEEQPAAFTGQSADRPPSRPGSACKAACRTRPAGC